MIALQFCSNGKGTILIQIHPSLEDVSDTHRIFLVVVFKVFLMNTFQVGFKTYRVPKITSADAASQEQKLSHMRFYMFVQLTFVFKKFSTDCALQII